MLALRKNALYVVGGRNNYRFNSLYIGAFMSKNKFRVAFENLQIKIIPLQYGDDSVNHPKIVKGSLSSQIVCAFCGKGDYCRGCEDPKKKHNVQNKYVLDHNHLHCKKGCKVCLRGLVHDFCNKVAIQALDNLIACSKLDTSGQLHQTIVSYLNLGRP